MIDLISLKQTTCFLQIFLECLKLVLGDNKMKKVNSFQIGKVQPQSVA